MAKLAWDAVGARFFETGLDQGVLYTVSDLGVYETGVAWNGLISVSESPEGGEVSPQYADNIKYLELVSNEEFKATIEAFTYPAGFAGCMGHVVPTPGVFVEQQSRKRFGLAYRTRMGNDILGTDYGYKLHMVWGCLAAPSERSNQTINDSPEPQTFSWEISSTPVVVDGYKPISHIVVDSVSTTEANLVALEEALFGTLATEATLPSPSAVLALITPAG